MAGKSRNRMPLQNGASDDQHNDFAPPPSTIAAQIVQNRSIVSRQEPENKALFGKLLQEYLKDPVIEDSNVETNAQLIGVVAEAGLDILLSEDPFAPPNLLEQAADSLLVIKLTINRKPEVLLHHGENANSEERPPLCLWLFAKVLNLLGRRNILPIGHDLSGLLVSISDTLCRNTRTWRQGIAFQKMVKDIVEGIVLWDPSHSIRVDMRTDLLQLLENGGFDIGEGHLPVALPSASRMTCLWPSGRNLLVLPPGYQAQLRNPVQARLAVVQLLSALSNFSQGSVSKLANWMMDCCYRVVASCVSASEITTNDFDITISSICRLMTTNLRKLCPKSKIAPLVDLFVELLQSFRPKEHPLFLAGVEDFVDAIVEACESNRKRADYCQRFLAPAFRDRINSDDSAQLTELLEVRLTLSRGL